MKAITMETKTFQFRDGQEITLKEPTILQMISAQRKTKDELEIAKNLLIDMSNGELTIESINNLPFSEFKRLCNVIQDFSLIESLD